MKYIRNLDAVPKNRCGQWRGNKVLINVLGLLTFNMYMYIYAMQYNQTDML